MTRGISDRLYLLGYLTGVLVLSAALIWSKLNRNSVQTTSSTAIDCLLVKKVVTCRLVPRATMPRTGLRIRAEGAANVTQH